MAEAGKKKIVLTGGGTAGHVTPNIALLPALREAGYEVAYVGSENGIERELMRDCGIPYIGVPTGKLRRYFDLKNFTDPFRVIKGYSKARQFLKSYRPDVVFSKGGFVSVPVVRAAASLKIPCVIHESDMTPGLANKLCYGAASKVCCNFPETVDKLPKGKAVLTGTPIRAELFTGDREEGLRICGFAQETEKPVLMIMGGSQGAQSVNEAVRRHLDELLQDFRVVHLCGAGKYDASRDGIEGYKQFEYISDELPDLFAAADILISRAGANAICEIAALAKPNVLIPLPLSASRGDQIKNAESFEKQGFSAVLDQDNCTASDVADKVFEVYNARDAYVSKMKENASGNGAITKIADLIETLANGT